MLRFSAPLMRGLFWDLWIRSRWGATWVAETLTMVTWSISNKNNQFWPSLTSKNKSQQGFGIWTEWQNCLPFFVDPWNDHRVQEITWIEWFCHLKDGGRPQKMVPFDVRKMRFFCSQNFVWKPVFPRIRGKIYRKTNLLLQNRQTKDGVKWAWYLKRLGHVMVWPCDGFNQYSCLRYHL